MLIDSIFVNKSARIARPISPSSILMGGQMEQPKTYADITLLINLVMDFIILWATAKLSGSRIRWGRMAAASLLGAIYAVGYLFWVESIGYSLPFKVGFSVLMVVIGLGPKDWREARHNLLYFYSVSFMSAGAVLATAYLVPGSDRGFWLSHWSLLGGILSVLILGIYGGHIFIHKIVPALLKYRIEMHFGTQTCSGQGFLDTGNSLRDPVTRRPVVVAEYGLIRNCLPQDCRDAVEKNPDENDRLKALSECSWASRLRLIPYSSIGQKNGLLVGFRCDEIIIDPHRLGLSFKNLTIGVYLEKLSSQGDYQLLIPSEIMQNI